jgi:hypothetical protein
LARIHKNDSGIGKAQAIWIAVVVAISIPLLVAGIHLLLIRIRVSQLERADHRRIVSACREMIANRTSYPNDKAKWGTLHEGDVLLLPPISDAVPQAIRELRPRNIIITGDYVIIDVRLPLSRIGLIGFAVGATEFGTFRLIDGLWFWNGNIQKPSKGHSN